MIHVPAEAERNINSAAAEMHNTENWLRNLKRIVAAFSFYTCSWRVIKGNMTEEQK